MVRSDIIKQISADTGLKRNESERIVDIILISILNFLLTGSKLEIRGFGTLSIKERKSRTARNLKTNESMPLAARKVLVYKPSKELKIIDKDTGSNL
jgi:nucleoid DNA-binding protein